MGESSFHGKDLREVPLHWLYRNIFSLLLIPLSVALLFPSTYPLVEISFDPIYWKFAIAMIMTIPLLMVRTKAGLPLPITIITMIFVSWTLYLSIARLELLVFILFIPPAIIHFIGGNFGKKGLRKLFDGLYSTPLTLGYLVLWTIPVEPVINMSLGSSEQLLYKGLITLIFGVTILLWGYLFEKKASLLLGTLLSMFSLIFLSVVFFEPLVFIVAVMVPAIYWFSRMFGPLPRGESMRNFISGMLPFNNVVLVVCFLLLFFPSVYPVIDLGGGGQEFWIYRGLLLFVFSGSVLAYGLYRAKDSVTILNGIILSSATILALSFLLWSELAFLLFLLLFIINREVVGKASDQDERDRGIWYLRFLVLPFIAGFILIWFQPYHKFYDLSFPSSSYWAAKSFMAVVFSMGYYAWGMYRKESSTVILSLVFLTITIIVFGVTTLSATLLAVIFILYLSQIAKDKLTEDREMPVIPSPMSIFINIYQLPMLLVFILIWIPEAEPLMQIEPWSTGYFLLRGLIAILFSFGVMGCCIHGDRPYHFIISNSYLLITSFIMVIAVSEPFALLIYLVPVSFLISSRMFPKSGFKEAAVSLSRKIRGSIKSEEGEDTRIDTSLFREFRHSILGISVFFYLVLFVMIWTGPVKPLLDLDGIGHLWFVTGTMFVFALIPLFWGLSGVLRAHVLTGVLYIVINGWVIFLAQMEGLGVVVSLFFTAIMFIAGGLYFVWASKKQRSVTG
jgi:hypothetical protein